MTVSINSNIESLNTQRRLSESNRTLGDIFTRLSSGQRISKASDDAAGLAIARDFNADSRVYTQATRNFNDAISYLNIADGALNELSKVTIRLQELAEQSSNGTYSNTQRSALDSEAHALVDEYNRIISTTSFNGINFYRGGVSVVRFQGGYGTNGSISVELGNMTSMFTSGGTSITYQGDGTFASGITLDSINYFLQVETADLNGDGNTDIINAGLNGIRIALGNGNATFKAIASYQSVGNVTAVALVDLNNDGITDIINAAGLTDKVNVLIGNGNGTFKVPLSYEGGNISASSSSPSSIQVSDLDGDGKLDIINTAYADNVFNVFLGNGNGTLNARMSFTSISPTGESTLIDVNNDGIKDFIVTGDNFSLATFVHLGNGNGTFNAPLSIPGSVYTSYVGCTDLNNDNKVDLIVRNSGSYSVYLGNGNGTFNNFKTYLGVGFGSTATPKFGDFNNDGKIDILGTTGNSVGILFGNGNGTFKSGISYASAAVGVDVANGDFNNDAVADIVTVGAGAPGGMLINLANASSSTTSTVIPYLNLSTQTHALAALDAISSARLRISSERSLIGASFSRINVALQNLASSTENFKAAESRILSADIAEESASLVRTQILQRTASLILAQANQTPALALRLLQS